MAFHTLRNNKNPFLQVSSDGEFLVVPITAQTVEIVGWAVVRVSDLEPQFGSEREAQEWASQHRNPTNPPKK